MKVLYRGLILALLPLLVEVAFIASMTAVLNQAEQQRVIERLHREGASRSSHIFAKSAMLPFILVIGVYTKSEKLISLYDKLMAELKEMSIDFGKFADKHKEIYSAQTQQRVIDLMGKLVINLDNGRRLAENSITDSQSRSIKRLSASFNQAQDLVADDMIKLSAQGDKDTQDLENGLENTRRLQYLLLIAGIVLNVGVAIGLWYYFKLSFLDRIAVIAKNTESITGKAWLIPEMGGTDEIAQMDHAFHQMSKKLLKASEVEKSLFNNASDVIAVLDSNNKFLRINPAGERLWSTSIERLQSTKMQALIVPADLETFETKLAEAKATNVPVSFETGIQTNGNEKVIGLWSMYWSEETQNLYFIFHDITEQKNIEDERRNFLSLISQDLQKPLKLISGSVQELVTGAVLGLPAPAVEKLALAERNLKRLNTLVRDLIQVTEMESGKIELNQRQLSAGKINELAQSEIQILAEKKKATTRNSSLRFSAHSLR